MNTILPDVSGEEIIYPLDFKSKADKVIEELRDTVLNITENDAYTDEARTKKKTVKRNEIMPTVTPTLINCRLNRIFFAFAPIENPESIEPNAYILAYSEFSRIMEEINRFVVMNANKQLYCLFTGITTDDFNRLSIIPAFAPAFSRIITALSGQDFIGAESGLLESNAVITKMQAKDMGLNMRQTDETIIQIQQNKIDKVQVLNDLTHFRQVIAEEQKALPKSKKK